MATPYEKKLGLTGPLSQALPTDAEKTQHDALIEELRRQNNYETPEDTKKRHDVLDSLQKITEEFVRRVSRSQGLSEHIVKGKGGKIFTYGSFLLGAYGPGSDIDTLVVVPQNISKEDYFNWFPDLLLELAPKGSIEDLTSVQEAFVPIIKFVYSGISIDLIFSRLKQDQVSQDQTLLNDKVLQGLEEAESRSLNGNRVTTEILELVPQPAPFRTALRGIKLWAQRRAIYANIIGFPGGVAWAMMVARVCQLYPKATSSTIVLKFFKIMYQWQWPQPVLLKHVQQNGPNPNAKVWNPQIYGGDAKHLMPIITPAYPSMCATHNITHSTFEVIKRELKRGGDIVDQIFSKEASWKDLFVKQTFFVDGYKYYLTVISASTTKEAQKLWSGKVESRVRFLVGEVEWHESIKVAHPFNKGFKRVHKCNTDEEVQEVKIGSLAYLYKDIPTETTDLNHDPIVGGTVKDETLTEHDKPNEDAECTIIYTDTFYIGLELHEGAKSLDIESHVSVFKTALFAWPEYNKELSALSVQTTRNFDLPDDVFEEGERKPTKTTKKKKIAQKRNASTTEDSEPPAKRQQTSVAAAG